MLWFEELNWLKKGKEHLINSIALVSSLIIDVVEKSKGHLITPIALVRSLITDGGS